MASEALFIPERHLIAVIKIIRTGLRHSGPPKNDQEEELYSVLEKWCEEEEDYITRLK